MITLTAQDIEKGPTRILPRVRRLGVLMNRDKALISTIYSCFKQHVTYILLDPDWPDDRLRSVVKNLEIDQIITNRTYAPRLGQANSIIVEDQDIICFESGNQSNGIAYILYTSGTTGQPNGVAIPFDALSNFIEGICEIIDFSPEKRIACFTTVTFDIFFLESIMALYEGLTVMLANEEEQRNPKFMAKLIQDGEVDMIQMTPSRMRLLLNYDKELSCLKKVKEIMVGGEPFPLSLLRTLQEKTTAKIYNMYGPTETTIWSTVSDLTHKDRIDIGCPIKNTEVYIVDENLSILPNGQAGEMCISGKGLAAGYAGKEDLTARKFIYLPQKPSVRVYRTGDIGRYLPDGNLEYLGRIDNQIKLRGHRIELEEIEEHLNEINGINQAVVIVSETSETDHVLEAIYTGDVSLTQKEIIEHLSSKLPEYMIPVKFKCVERFILTPSGKIDRKKVSDCVEVRTENSIIQDANTSRLSDTQKKVIDVITTNANLSIDDITLETEFMKAGVNSITFIKIVVALEDEFGFEFDDEMLLLTVFPTIKSIIEYVETKVK